MKIERLKSLSILDVAQKLGIRYTRHGRYRMCHCFMHEDRIPSLWLRPADNRWKCESCDKGGDNITLVMEHERLSFPDAVRWLADRFGITIDDGRSGRLYQPPKRGKKTKTKTMTIISQQPDTRQPLSDCHLNRKYLEQCYSTGSPFCRALVENGILTDMQMRRAALRYHLGTTKDDGVIFWYIDCHERLCDGKIMFYRPDCHRDHDRHPLWVVARLKKQGLISGDCQPRRCLFGEHLLGQAAGSGCIVAVVESEKTAIICSELFPTLDSQPVIWLATGGLSNLTATALAPIAAAPAPAPANVPPAHVPPAPVPASSACGSKATCPHPRRLILFPDTDPDGTTYRKWRDTAIQAQQELRIPITVSTLLETHATPEQKARKIDIADLCKPQPPCPQVPLAGPKSN